MYKSYTWIYCCVVIHNEYVRGKDRLSPGIITSDIVDRIPVRSERWFASAFLHFFGKSISLYYHPPAIALENIGATEPDFLIDSQCMHLILEVTEARYARDHKRKPNQYKVREAYRTNVDPEFRHLEINGGALECTNWLMCLLGGVLSGNIKLYKAQKQINRLGWDDDYLHKIQKEYSFQ